MVMRRKLKAVMVFVGLMLVGLQFTSPPHTNPPFDRMQTLQSTSDVPPEVLALFERSCKDCHSNETDWRWYTYVAPVSWLTVGHVNDARGELNFSEWGTYGTRKKETRLKAICNQIQRGEMPLASYALIHPEVRLTADEVKAICEWTVEARKRLGGEH
jgi:hypothetical protein